LDDEPAVEDRLSGELHDETAALREALAQLPPERRAILAMFYLDDMSIRNIADAFSLPVGTVKSRLFHARNHLKQVIERRAE
jgi:RNA polymerase sigma-70 factor (ECF subfamily)